MALDQTIATLNDALVRRLYDDRGGHYVLCEVLLGQMIEIRPLSRNEALTFFCSRYQVLRHVYPADRPGLSRKRVVYRGQRRRAGCPVNQKRCKITEPTPTDQTGAIHTDREVITHVETEV